MANNRGITFIVTVPHYACTPADRKANPHPCDTSAAPAARGIADGLRRRGFAVEGPILGTTSRLRSDLNRAESRKLRWRTDLDNRIRAAARHGTVAVVDVHSFDRGAPWERDALLRGRPRPLVVFLDAGGYHSEEPMGPEWLASKMPREVAASSGGSPMNDIVLRSWELGARAVLVEVDEESSDRSPEWLATTADSVAAALVRGMPSGTFLN